MVSMMTPTAACRIAIVDKNRAAGPSFTSQLAGLFFLHWPACWSSWIVFFDRVLSSQLAGLSGQLAGFSWIV